MGDIETIKKSVTTPTFTFFIAVNMIGNWKGEGWNGLFSYHRNILPYIPDTLTQLGLTQLLEAFEACCKSLPDFATSCDEDAYVDVINFVTNTRFKVEDERLKAYNTEKRKQMCNNYRNNINLLDDLSMPLWGYGTKDNGWYHVVAFFKK